MEMDWGLLKRKVVFNIPSVCHDWRESSQEALGTSYRVHIKISIRLPNIPTHKKYNPTGSVCVCVFSFSFFFSLPHFAVFNQSKGSEARTSPLPAPWSLPPGRSGGPRTSNRCWGTKTPGSARTPLGCLEHQTSQGAEFPLGERGHCFFV